MLLWQRGSLSLQVVRDVISLEFDEPYYLGLGLLNGTAVLGSSRKIGLPLVP